MSLFKCPLVKIFVILNLDQMFFGSIQCKSNVSEPPLSLALHLGICQSCGERRARHPLHYHLVLSFTSSTLSSIFIATRKWQRSVSTQTLTVNLSKLKNVSLRLVNIGPRQMTLKVDSPTVFSYYFLGVGIFFKLQSSFSKCMLRGAVIFHMKNGSKNGIFRLTIARWRVYYYIVLH